MIAQTLTPQIWIQLVQRGTRYRQFIAASQSDTNVKQGLREPQMLIFSFAQCSLSPDYFTHSYIFNRHLDGDQFSKIPGIRPPLIIAQRYLS